ncbi:fungal-specific transcription factor domain-containing protein [Blakeslea trispora]|nr:fungal-specific transcription factor domain-containing protein [Blakeslea trispora]
MESLLTAITNCSIKELEANNFQYAGHIHSFTPNVSDSSSEDEDESAYESLAREKYDCMRYAGNSSSGAKLLDEHIFQAQSSIPWPGRRDVELRMMSQNELAVVQTQKCATTGKTSTHIDVGLSMQGPSHDLNSHSLKHSDCKKKPARHQLDKMIGLYFTHIHCILPIIHKKQFLERYHNMKTNGSLCILMQAVLALTFRFAGQRLPDLVKDGEEFGEMYFRKVMRKLREADHSRLCYVQATLLMALYLDMDGGDRESLEWSLVGSAVRMAQDLGLHRSCAKWNIPASEIEVRHRVFYGCYVLDRWLSARLGKPLTIMDRGFDVDMPSPYEVREESSNSELPANPSYRPFILMIKLCEILGRILKSLYAPNASVSNINAGLDNFTILTVLEHRLKDWKSSLDTPFDGIYIAEIDKYNLETHYYLVCILLYRPFTQLPASIHPNAKHVASSSVISSTHAANSLIETFLKRNKLCPVPSYHHLFCAPALLTYSLFQAALVHLSNALCEKSPTNTQIYCRSIRLIRGISSIGLAPRVSDSLIMLGVINRLFEADSEWLKDDFDPNVPIHAITHTPRNNPDSYLDNTPHHSFVQHRTMNTSVIGGITPDIQSNVGIMIDRSYPHQPPPFNYHISHSISHNNNDNSNHENSQGNYKHNQIQSNSNHSSNHSNHYTHHRSISLDQISNITPHIVSSHSRSASYDQFDFTMSTYQHTNRASQLNYSSLNTLSQQQKPFSNPHENRHTAPIDSYLDNLPRTAKPFTNSTEVYNPNVNSNPSSTNWNEWNTFMS